MTSSAKTPDDYFASLPDDRKTAMNELRNTIKKAIPKGFEETMAYGMVAYVVPHSKYPTGYHCDPKQPLPFVSVASQKNFIALYHMGIYMNPDLLQWFTDQYPKFSKAKLDMDKSCIRFKKPEQIPFALVGDLMKKVTPDEWIAQYESVLKK